MNASTLTNKECSYCTLPSQTVEKPLTNDYISRAMTNSFVDIRGGRTQETTENIGGKPIFIRPPRTGYCAYTGLSRSKIYELICGGNPPVRSISLKRGDQQRATRLIHFQSLLDYIESFAENNTNGSHAEDNQQ